MYRFNEYIPKMFLTLKTRFYKSDIELFTSRLLAEIASRYIYWRWIILQFVNFIHKFYINTDFQAMCCQLHISALIAEYLKLRGKQSWGADEFAELSMNILRDETGLKIDEGK